MTVQDYKLAYKHFLINVTKHSRHSANKYVSYINKVCPLPGMHDLWERLATCENPEIKTKYVEALCDEIATALDDPSCTIKEKDLRDSQSSAHVLLAFVSGQIWAKHKGIQIQFTSIYNKKALRSKFLSRLTTQDRIYSFGAFPIYIVNSIARQRKISLFDKMIDETKFIYNNKGDYFYFKDIDRVMIGNDGHAYFSKDRVVYTVFTQIPKKTPAEYCVAHIPKIDDLSLDHDNPVKKVLKSEISTMPVLNLLSQDIWKFKQSYKSTHKSADNRAVLGAYKHVMMKVDEVALIKETEAFLNQLSLTIMERGFNSSKNDSVS